MVNNIRFFFFLFISGLCLTDLSAGLATIRVRKGASGLEIFHQNKWQQPLHLFGSDPHVGVLKTIVPNSTDKTWNKFPTDGSLLPDQEEYCWPLYAVPMGGNLAEIKQDLSVRYESTTDASKGVNKSFVYGVDFEVQEGLNISGNDTIGSIATISLKREGNLFKVNSNGVWKDFSSLVGGDPAPDTIKKFYLKSNPDESVRDDDFQMYTDGEVISWVIAKTVISSAIKMLPNTYEFVYESIDAPNQSKSVTLKSGVDVTISVASPQVTSFITKRNTYHQKIAADKAATEEAERRSIQLRTDLNNKSWEVANAAKKLYGVRASLGFGGRYRNLDKDWLGRPWQRYMAFLMRRRGNSLDIHLEGIGWKSVAEHLGDPDIGYIKRLYVSGDANNYLHQNDYTYFKDGEEFYWLINANRASYKSGDEQKVRLVFESYRGPQYKSENDGRARIHDNLEKADVGATQFADKRFTFRESAPITPEISAIAAQIK